MGDDIYENNVYSFLKKMWHIKGTVGQNEETASDVYKGRMKKVNFISSPYSTEIEGVHFDSKTKGIFRVENGKVIEIGEFRGDYEITQPDEYIEAFDKYVGKPVETMGFLGASKADKLFITWVLPQIDIHGDIMEIFGMIVAGFNGKFGNHLYATDVRTVCKNTMNLAIHKAMETNNMGRGTFGDNGAIFSGKHSRKDHVERLGYWMRYIQQDAENTVSTMRSLFCKMEETPITVDQAFGIVSSVYSYPKDVGTFIPPELVNEENEKYDDGKTKADEKRDLAMSLFDGGGIQITPTVYGAFNAITELENHHVDCRKNDGVESILIGNRQQIMQKAFTIASDYVAVRS